MCEPSHCVWFCVVKIWYIIQPYERLRFRRGQDDANAGTSPSFPRFGRDVRALFSLLSLLMQFARDLTAQEARKSKDGGIRFGRKIGRCISIGPLLLHCGHVQDLKYAQLLEP